MYRAKIRVGYCSLAITALLLVACGGGSNDAPMLEPIADVTISANQSSVPIEIAAVDDDDELTFSVSSSDESVIAGDGLMLLGDGRRATLILTPNPATLGSVTIVVSAADPDGLVARSSFGVTVEAQRASLRQFVRDVFADAETAQARDINSRVFDADIEGDEFADLLN
ncbi:MAG: hypothetical protein AAF515_13010 [Pseudomonadota bacterium]